MGDVNKPSARRPSSSRRRSKPSASRRTATQHSAPEQATSSGQRFVDERHGEGRSVKASPQKAKQKATASDSRWEKWKPHVRKYGVPLLINHAVTVGIILAVAVIAGIGAGFSRVPATIASLWMVVNLGALNMTGAELGFLPLLPAMIVVWAHGRRATTILGKSMSVRGLRTFVVLSLAIPLFLTLIAWLMLWDASRVFDMAAPNLAEALLSTLLVNGAAVVVGMRPPVWRALLLRRELPTWPVEAFRLAGSFLKWMFVVGAVAALIYAATNANAFMETYDITNDLMGAFGLTLLALLYLPNLAIGAMAVLLGGEFHVGNGAISLFTATNVSLPPLPILAAVPNQPLPGGPFFLAVPAIVAIFVVYRYVKSRGFLEAPVATSIGSGACVALLGFCIAWLAGGELGVYGSAGALEWLFAAESAAWLMVPALVLMIWAARAGNAVVEDVAPSASSPSSTTPPASAHDVASNKEEETEEDNQDASEAAEPEAETEEVDADGVENNEKPDDTEEQENKDEEGDNEGSDSGLGDGDAAPKRD